MSYPMDGRIKGNKQLNENWDCDHRKAMPPFERSPAEAQDRKGALKRLHSLQSKGGAWFGDLVFDIG